MRRRTTTVSISMLIPGARLLARESEKVQAEAQRRIRALLIQEGVDPADLADPESRIPLKIILEESEICAQVTGNPAFGIHAAISAEKGDFGLFEYLSVSAATLGDSIRASSKYLTLLSDGAVIDLVYEGDFAIWRHHLTLDAPGPPAAHEFVVCSFFQSTARALGFKPRPIEVHFIHDKPSYVEEYEKFFDAPLRFNMQYNESVMPRWGLDIPLITRDDALHAMLTRHADNALERLALRPLFSQRVRNIIREQMKTGEIGVKDMSCRLRMSERTLRRRLAGEGAGYKELVDEVRKDLARDYLTTSELPISEIARRIGFTNPSAFYRAFREWYGVAPAEFRNASIRNPFFSFINR
jgi:AraC-like DNA-binding protein